MLESLKTWHLVGWPRWYKDVGEGLVPQSVLPGCGLLTGGLSTTGDSHSIPDPTADLQKETRACSLSPVIRNPRFHKPSGDSDVQLKLESRRAQALGSAVLQKS